MFKRLGIVLLACFVPLIHASVLGNITVLENNSDEAIRLSEVARTMVKLSLDNDRFSNFEYVGVEEVTQQEIINKSSDVILKFEGNSSSMSCFFNIYETPRLSTIMITLNGCTVEDFGYTGDDVEPTDDSDLKKQFDHFIKKYDKMYANDTEYKKRFEVFKQNLEKISLYESSEQGSAKYNVTYFADFTEDEYKKYQGYLKFDVMGIKHTGDKEPTDSIPEEFDWRENNAVTPVKRQQNCASGWAFSAVGVLEGQYALKYKKLESLSVQQLIDCTNTTSDGCNGSNMFATFGAVRTLGGIESETDYPYTAERGQCYYNKSLAKAEINHMVFVIGNEMLMKHHLYKTGPISVALNSAAMQFYTGGVAYPTYYNCDPTILDHAGVIVGYGVEKSTTDNQTLPYWIIKNSWGEDWGENGYYRLYRGNGTCGINKRVITATIK